jgi:anthranilate phosphoribosyltransferase
MNIVGPLANPASAGRQVIGVAEPRRLPLLAGALAALGTTHALVVHGEPGMDEISPLGPTRVLEVKGGAIGEWTIEPETYGLGGAAVEELAGAGPAENAGVIADILDGGGARGARAAVLLNAAAAIYVAGRAASFGDGVRLAERALVTGEGMRALERLRTAFERPRAS